MNKDDHKVIRICDDCKIDLVFYDDCEKHYQKTGHLHLTAYDFDTGRLLKNKRVRIDSSQQSSMDGVVT